MDKDVKCPYCNHPQNIDHDEGYGYEEDITYQQECPNCEKIFVYTTGIIYVYDTHQADCLNGGEHDYQPVHHYPKYWPSWVRCKLCDDEIKGDTIIPEEDSNCSEVPSPPCVNNSEAQSS